LPRRSSADRPSLLIAAVSGRALAASTRRAGYAPLVADFFADADCQALAHACHKLDGALACGMRADALLAALRALAEEAPSPIDGFIYGAGFEDRPELLREIAKRWPVLGNDAATVERIKAPQSFFAELDRLGIPHPRTVTEAPVNRNGWLAKRRGGAGGGHIVASDAIVSFEAAAPVYFQEQVAGRAVSVLFLADGVQARALGFSEQWTAPTDARPFRYGGAVRPAALSPELAKEMAGAVERVAAAFGLKGLCSADFMVNESSSGQRQALLLEVNPRPGATLDIFDTDAEPLLRLHLDAVRGRPLASALLAIQGASASGIVFAREAVAVPDIDWPPWTADRPRRGERIDKNGPICTVWARAETPAEAKRLVEERISIILATCGRQSMGGDGELGEANGRERNAQDGATQRQ
jgi:uncharacterized protein